MSGTIQIRYKYFLKPSKKQRITKSQDSVDVSFSRHAEENSEKKCIEF
jgi:hypothetical protein